MESQLITHCSGTEEKAGIQEAQRLTAEFWKNLMKVNVLIKGNLYHQRKDWSKHFHDQRENLLFSSEVRREWN